MKKVLAMLTAILFCGAILVSCGKEENKTPETSNTPTKTDMVGTWGGTYTGTATINNESENYSINWTLVLNAEGSATVGSLRYHATFATMQDLSGEMPVTDYYVRQNTSTGRISIVGGPNFGILDVMIDFDIDLCAKTMKGNLEVHTSFGEDGVTLGGNTTLNKR